MENSKVKAPAGYVPAIGIGYGAIGGDVCGVAVDTPLPVSVRGSQAASSATALIGSATQNEVTAPFVPELGRPIWLTLAAGWTGSVTVKRSTDGGVTLHPLTFVDGSPKGVFTGNACTVVGEETVAGATWYLDIAPTDGSVDYRLEQ